MRRVYQIEDGRWVYNLNYTAYYFDTEPEARETMAKIDTATAVVNGVKQLIFTADNGVDIVEDYFENGPFDDAHLVALGITAAQLTACITLLQNFELFMAEDDPLTPITNAKYRATLNQVRHV